jgi:hypothetical protein
MEIERIDNTKGEPPGEWPEHFQGNAKIQQIATALPNGTDVFAVHFDAGAGAGLTSTPPARSST